MPVRSVCFHAVAAAVVLAVTASGCAPKPLYDWGTYEDGLYSAMVKGAGDPQTRATRLEADIQKTISRGRRVPPGVHVELGYLYAQTGRTADARAQFEAEKAAFPESAAFVDGMIARMGHVANAPGSASAAPKTTEETKATSQQVPAEEPQKSVPSTTSEQSKKSAVSAVTDERKAPASAAIHTASSGKPLAPPAAAGIGAPPQVPAAHVPAGKVASEPAPPASSPPTVSKSVGKSATKATGAGSTASAPASPSVAATHDDSPAPVDPSQLLPPSYEERD